ncbi:hypothetical protein JQN58_26445 [Aneurinibacillus sp. BA2021]|nr:hypothetical protein [Aneurinibacillus sp. BA2021]
MRPFPRLRAAVRTRERSEDDDVAVPRRGLRQPAVEREQRDAERLRRRDRAGVVCGDLLAQRPDAPDQAAQRVAGDLPMPP